MAEEFLDGANIVAGLEKMGGETVAKGVRGDGFVYFGKAGSVFDGALKHAFVKMMAHGFASLGIHRALAGGKEVLPARFAVGIGIFPFEGVWEMNLAIAFLQVALVNIFHLLNVGFESGNDSFGEGDRAVIFAFSIANDDLMVGEVDIFDAKSKTFHKPQARTEEELGHEFGDAAHFFDDGDGFGFGEDGGKAVGFSGTDEVGGEFDLLEENVTIEEEDGAEGLIPPAPTAGAV